MYENLIIGVAGRQGGLDAAAPAIRARSAGSLAFLGVGIDAAANDQVEGDAEITAPGAPVRTVVLRAREDLEMARQTRTALSG